MQKIIITGASGFIGQSLADTFSHNKNYEIALLSKTHSTKPYKFIQSFADVPEGEILIHLAETSDRNVVNNLGEIYINEAGSAMDILLKKEYKKVIYLSSSAVYGDIGCKPFKEIDEVIESDIYSTSKLVNEKKVLANGGIVIRVANVIGPNMAKKNVLSEMLAQLNTGNEITIKNDKPIRDFIWHKDLVNAIVKLLQVEGPDIFNIGSGKGTSIREIAEIISKVANQKYKINSLDKGNLTSYNVVDIEKIKKNVNWEPKYKIENIIGEMI